MCDSVGKRAYRQLFEARASRIARSLGLGREFLFVIRADYRDLIWMNGF